jgi:integrase
MTAIQATLWSRAKDYLVYRRSLGFELETADLLLREFAEYVKAVGHRGPLTADLILGWATRCPEHSACYQAGRLSILRGFARYLAARDGKTEVPEQRLLESRFRRRQPHIYTEEQLAQLIKSTGSWSTVGRLRCASYATLFGLLASTGLRVSEALALQLGDVDLERGVLHIRQTKFRKARLVPVHSTVAQALGSYASTRHCHLVSPSQWFFVGRGDQPLSYSSVRQAFRKLCSRLGWRSNGDFPLPRIHDLRHSFAVRRLLQWHRGGVDVETAIASLSTYLGHGKVTDTYWYLTGTRELLAVAGGKFERFTRSAPRTA